jgi:hypothetical protein
VPYLFADPALAAAWRARIGDAGFRIGILWQGNPGYKGDHKRSIPLACFAPLAAVPGVRLISLQKNHGLDQLARLPAGMTVETLASGFDDGPDAFIDSAAVMMSLDLIVSIDSAAIHLAGALGRPAWLPLASIPHWVWGLEREDTPWYPSLTLFRQKLRGEWGDVFRQMAAKLTGMTQDRELA